MYTDHRYLIHLRVYAYHFHNDNHNYIYCILLDLLILIRLNLYLPCYYLYVMSDILSDLTRVRQEYWVGTPVEKFS